MNTILLSMSIDETQKKTTSWVSPPSDILDLAPGFYNDGQMRIPFTQGLVRMYKDRFCSNSKRTETSLRLHNKTRIWWRVSNSFTTADDWKSSAHRTS
jgi:hypothetical protein